MAYTRRWWQCFLHLGSEVTRLNTHYMHANLKGALEQLNKAWSAFRHNGQPLTKREVKALLEYGIRKGYTTTEELTDPEVDEVLRRVRGN